MINPYLLGFARWNIAWWVVAVAANLVSITNFILSCRRLRRSRERMLQMCAWWEGHCACDAAWIKAMTGWIQERAARGEPPPFWTPPRLSENPWAKPTDN